MHSDVIGFVALDLILRLTLAGMVGIALVVDVTRVDLHYRAAGSSGFRVPGNVVADFESYSHDGSPRIRNRCALYMGERGHHMRLRSGRAEDFLDRDPSSNQCISDQ
jgi:hypothetical protein